MVKLPILRWRRYQQPWNHYLRRPTSTPGVSDLVRFGDAETEYEVPLSIVGAEKGVIYPNYINRRLYQSRVGVTPPETNPERLIAAVLPN